MKNFISIGLWIAITSTCFATASFTGSESAVFTLKVGYSESPPHRYTDENGKASGPDIEYFSRVLDAAKIDYQFISYPWKRVLLYIETGQVDVTLAAANIEDRQDFAYFSDEAFSISDNTLFIKRKHAQELVIFESLSDLIETQFRIGVTRGSSYSDEYDTLLLQNDFTKRLIQLSSTEQSVNMALGSRIDGFIASRALGEYELGKRCQLKKFVPVYDLLKNENNASYLMYSKKTVSLEMINKIDEVLRTLPRVSTATNPIVQCP